MAKNISGYYTQGFNITYPKYDPVNVSGVINAKNAFGLSWYVSAGFYVIGSYGKYHLPGPPYYPAAITNTGTIKASLTLDSTGVYIFAGNGASGGSLLNQGLISGVRGVQVYGGTGTITNAGSIIGYVKPGVELLFGGDITNKSGGSIIGKGTAAAVYATGPATVSNTGWLGNLTNTGIDLKAGGTLRNFFAGTITSGATKGSAVYLKGTFAVENDGLITGYRGFSINSPSTLNNYGTIIGLQKGAIDLFGGGNVTNQAGGTIAAQGTGSALYSTGGTANVVNLGIITAISSVSTGVDLKAGGALHNQAGATIDGGAGVGVLASAPATVSNDGLIENNGTHTGVRLTAGGTVSNFFDGTITATSASAVYFMGVTGQFGTLVNSGSITSGTTASGVWLNMPGLVSNAAKAMITGGAYGVRVDGAGGSVTNAGTILVAAGVPASDGVAFGAAASNASLTNAAQGYVTGVLAVLGAGSADSVLNGGTLLAGSMGVYLKAGGQVTNQGGGLIQGTGQIPGSGLAAGYGVRVIGAAGTVSNSGTIYGRNSAIALTAGGMIANQVGALIKNQVAKSAVITIPVATAAAIAIIGPTAGTVVNAGTIGAIGTLAPPGGTTEDLSGAFAAVGVTSGSGLYLSNLSTGLIAGVYGVLSAGGPASLSNAGTIQSNGTSKIGAGAVGAAGNQSGVYLKGTPGAQAYLSNASGGLIAGYFGVKASGAATIVNAGTIAGQTIASPAFSGAIANTTSGVYLASGGSVTNLAGASIQAGGTGLNAFVANYSTTIRNAGTISGTEGVHIWGGSLTNQAGGMISSTGDHEATLALNTGSAVRVDTYGTVVNAGTMVGQDRAAVEFRYPSSYAGKGPGIQFFSNASTGLVLTSEAGPRSGAGVVLNGPGSVINAGTIDARVGLANGNSVTNMSGAYLYGVAAQGGGPVATTVVNGGIVKGAAEGIVIAGPASILNQAGGQIIGLGNLPSTIPAGILVEGGAATIETAGTIEGGPGISTGGTGDQSVILADGFANRVIVDPGAVFLSGDGSPGGMMVLGSPGDGPNNTIELAPGTGALSGFGTRIRNFGSIAFDTGANWTLSGTAFDDHITGFDNGDTIDLTSFVAVDKIYSGGVLTLTDAAKNQVALNITSTFLRPVLTTNDFIVVGDGTGVGTDVTLDSLSCFAAGTRLATSRGAVAVEALTVADHLMTARGTIRPVVWIGSRVVNCAAHPEPEAVWPVRIARDAFGPGQPGRDLYLSPDHAVFVNDVLVPVKLLVNDTSITRVARPRVTYYHVQLPEHAVILAEGLTVESYLDTGDRANFQCAGEPIRLFADFGTRPTRDLALLWETRGAAPLVMAGARLGAARLRVCGHPDGMLRPDPEHLSVDHDPLRRRAPVGA